MTHPALQFLGTFALLVVGALLCCVAISGKRTPPPLLVLLAFGLLCGGCATNGVKRDDFPAGVPCVQARNDAIQWYRATRHKDPVIRPVRVLITQAPPDGQGGLTSGSGGGFLIRLWKDQYPFYGSLVHEFKHTMGPENFLSEEAVR